MRGKKSDPIFISAFIQQCLEQRSIVTLQQIVSQAQQEIATIDQHIQTVEQEKKRRTQLLDVVALIQEDKPLPININLSLYAISYPHVCHQIINDIQTQGYCLWHYHLSQLSKEEEYNWIFCIKEMIQLNIVQKGVKHYQQVLLPHISFASYLQIIHK